MIALCPNLKPFITTNDKTPLTDGHIDAYSGPKHTKKNLTGRVPVQVKGRTGNRNRKTFPVDRTDLIGLQRVDGAIYFVVLFDKQGNGAPFYAILTPFKIAHLLKDSPKGKTVRVKITPLPSEPEKIQPIVQLAQKGRNQRTGLTVDPVLLENAASITLYSSTPLDFDGPVVLDVGETDFAVELTTTGGSTVPLDVELRIFPQDYIEREVDLTISAGGATYVQAAVRRIDAESVEVRLAEGLVLVRTATTEYRMLTVNLSLQSNFAERLKAIEFVIGIAESGEVRIDEHPVTLRIDGLGGPQLANLHEQLSLLRSMRDLFEHLDVDSSLVDLDAVDDGQIHTLLMLHRAFVRGENIEKDIDPYAKGIVTLGKWELLVLVTPGDAPEFRRLADPFGPEAPTRWRWTALSDEDQQIPITAYDTVARDRLPKLLNLRLSSIVDAYETIADCSETTKLANFRILDLIWVAGECVARREEFLSAAEKLNEWLIDKDGEQSIHLINRWQIKWRNGSLDSNDKRLIRELRHRETRAQDTTENLAMAWACAILLGETAEADYLASLLPEGQIQKMENWPIWQIYGRSGNS